MAAPLPIASMNYVVDPGISYGAGAILLFGARAQVPREVAHFDRYEARLYPSANIAFPAMVRGPGGIAQSCGGMHCGAPPPPPSVPPFVSPDPPAQLLIRPPVQNEKEANQAIPAGTNLP